MNTLVSATALTIPIAVAVWGAQFGAKLLLKNAVGETVQVLQKLIDALKEYGLNPCSRLIICVRHGLHIIYIDKILIPWIGRLQFVSSLVVLLMQKLHELLAPYQ